MHLSLFIHSRILTDEYQPPRAQHDQSSSAESEHAALRGAEGEEREREEEVIRKDGPENQSAEGGTGQT